MNIAIVSRSNIEDRTYWSGVIEKVYYSLKLVKGIKVIKIDKLNNSIRKIYSLKREFLKYTKKEKYDDAYNKFVSKNFANQIKRKIEQNNIYYILCFDSSLIAHLDTKIPIILWTDLLYQDYYEHYFHNQNISINTLKSIRKIENLSIRKCHKILLPTKWAIKNAKIRHKSHSKKFYLLPFGINLKTSIISGTFSIITFSLVNKVAHRICKASFLAPWGVISPDNFTPPSTLNEFIYLRL